MNYQLFGEQDPVGTVRFDNSVEEVITPKWERFASVLLSTGFETNDMRTFSPPAGPFVSIEDICGHDDIREMQLNGIWPEQRTPWWPFLANDPIGTVLVVEHGRARATVHCRAFHTALIGAGFWHEPGGNHSGELGSYRWLPPGQRLVLLRDVVELEVVSRMIAGDMDVIQRLF